MQTPWGDTEALRADRLGPGPRPDGRQASERHQRRRIFAALVAAVASEGYNSTTERQLARESGVARSGLHKVFPGGIEQSFLAAVDILYKDALTKMWAGYHSESDPERALHAALSTAAQAALSQPHASTMALVHIYEAGPAGIQRAQRAAGELGQLIADSLSRSPQRAQGPAELPAAIAGAIQMLFHDRLRRGLQDQLPQLADQLADWTLSYESPPAPLARSRAQVRPIHRDPDPDPGIRLLHATARLCAQNGYRNVSVSALAREAKTSLRTLYERYGGKQECFLAAFEMTRARTHAAAQAAFTPLIDDWPRAFHAAIRAILRFFATEPQLTWLVAVEVLAAGPDAWQARDQAIRTFTFLLDPGYKDAPHAPQIAREAIPFGVYFMIHHHLTCGRPAATLPQLAPLATFLALCPAIGAQRAAQIAAEKPTLPAAAPPPPVRFDLRAGAHSRSR